MISRALYVAADLQIADLLLEKPCTISDLAQTTGMHESSLERLLTVLCLHTIFSKDEFGKYHNTVLSQVMAKNHPHTVRPLLLHEDGTRWNCYGNLGYSIATGSPVFDALYGISYFDYIAHDAVLNDRFNEAMVCISDFEEEILSASYPFAAFGRIVDIGGGRGGLLRKILKKNDGIHAILADLAKAIENHPLVSEFPDRATVMPLNFFEPIDIVADLYMLKRVLHDWNDDQAIQILKNIKNSMPQGSKLLIMESILDQNNKESALIDLILLSVFGGRERTVEEYAHLIHALGLTIKNIYNTESSISIIECC